jgi:hypothetical protein
MAVRVARFAAEFAALADWSGTQEQELRALQDYHADDHERWLAWDGDHIAGVLNAWHAPDGRLRLYFGRCRADAYEPLAATIGAECYATIDSSDHDALRALAAARFAELRRENEYEIPVSLLTAPVPAGIRIVTADQTELEPLMLLDCTIRADIPGSDGWQPDPEWFREETYDSPEFDPQTYRVALDGTDYVGPGPHLEKAILAALPAARMRGRASRIPAARTWPGSHRGGIRPAGSGRRDDSHCRGGHREHRVPPAAHRTRRQGHRRHRRAAPDRQLSCSASTALPVRSPCRAAA